MQAIPRALVLIAAISLASCGGAAVTEGPTFPTSSDEPAASELTITRTGGFAGVHDVVQIEPDGSASVSQKTGVISACTPTPEAVDRVRAIDLSALGTAPPKTPIMDGFGYEIVGASGTASVGDGDTGSHGDLLAAAAEVVSSCLTTVSDSGIYQ